MVRLMLEHPTDTAQVKIHISDLKSELCSSLTE